MYNTELPTQTKFPIRKQLLRSTTIALIVAAVLLVTAVLPSAPAAQITAPSLAIVAANANIAQKSDETVITLKPNEGVEYKLEMSKGAKAKYEWTSAGGPVNHNLHTDGAGGSHSYSKGTGVERDAGEITAVSDGYHGWFWRNRNSKDVTITLKTSGDYKSIKRM